MQPYTERFYNSQKEGSRRSAEAIVPLVLDLIRPQSVIDVGCGVGTWLSVFRNHGVRDVLGLDGEYVEPSMLEIPSEQFFAMDLSRPIQIDRTFDLVVSLEVAEHLPEQCARTFVESLTRLGPVILFSAAIPFQGGTGHVNEQWPEYWANYFRENGYEAIDCIRQRVWHNDQVEWWYAQNTLMFARKESLDNHALFKKAFANSYPSVLSFVHPKKYSELVRMQLAARDLAALIPGGENFILVDQDQLREYLGFGCRAIPFLERAGQYWGPPPDDQTAIREFERIRQSGVIFIVFLWPAFWWLDFYSEFARYLYADFNCVFRNNRLLAFDLHR